MKTFILIIKNVLVLSAVLTIVTGCASGKPTVKRFELESENSVVTLEHKGTGLGVTKLPAWLSEYFERGVPGVEALADYQGKYCIVGDERGPELEEVLVRANSFNTQQQIGAQISTSIASVFKANESKVPDEASSRKYSNALNTLVNASYTGARKEGDWWLKQRISESGAVDEIRFTAYVLYSIDRKMLDTQIANQITRMKDGTPGLDEAFDAIVAEVLTKGLDW
jgi:hypothetical protein